MSSEVLPPAGTRSELLPDVKATHAFAQRIAARLRPGDVVALVGDLGAGKTEFTRGLARALELPEDAGVCSPSYLLLNLYCGGRLPIAHFDAYFMRSADDLERAGLSDLLRDGCVAVVEWGDRVPGALPGHTLWLELRAGAQAGTAREVRCWGGVAATRPGRG